MNTDEINLSILFIICYKVTECYNITFVIARINIVNKINSETLIKVDNVGLFKNDKWLVKGVSLEVKRGEIVTLIGPNGSGKTTTAKIALGIHKNIDGKVLKFTEKVGYVPQKISIDWTLPIRVVDFMLLTQNLSDEEITNALKLTGVEHLKNNNLSNLSGGEFQRVLIARAIAKNPDLLVLDEPVQGAVSYTHLTLPTIYSV